MAQGAGQSARTLLDITSPLVLRTGHDEMTDAAVNTLTQNIPEARVKTVNDLTQIEGYSKISVNQIFYVGHGNPYGLKIGNKVAAWKEIQASTAEFRGIRQYFVACNSELMSSPRTTAFSGVIDAEIGASIAVWQYNQICDKDGLAVTAILDLAQAKAEGRRPTYPLYYLDPGGGGGGGGGGSTAYWGTTEKIWAAIDFAIWVITTVAGLGGLSSTFKWAAQMVYVEIAASCVQIATYLIRYALGQMGFTDMLCSIFSSLWDIMWAIVQETAVWIIVAFGLAIGVHATTGGVTLALTLIASLISLGFWVATVVSDYYDSNDIYDG
jgi:hypothetical protein